MRNLRRIVSLGAFMLLTTSILADDAAAEDAVPEDATPKEKWIQLFNGKNLDGWKVKIRHYPLGENFANTFRVEDGLMKVAYDGYENFDARFGHIFYEKEFSHYRLRVEYRFVGKQIPGGAGWALRNSGLMLHGQTAESMKLDQDFPDSIEVQLLGGNGKDKRTTFNLCTPGTNVVMNGKLFTPHCTSSSSKTYHGNQWVTGEVEVRGNKIIKHIIDGKTVLSYTKPQLNARRGEKAKMLDHGTISLQSESHPVEFRKVELLELKE